MNTQTVNFDQLIERGCGIDVHKNLIVATIQGAGLQEQTRSYDGFTESLEQLRDWLKESGVTHVAMESTGVYWKPVYNVLEADFEVILVNAWHFKNVPGHKTDKKDSKWIAKLLLCGLLKGSFIPPKPIREMRDLTRYKRKVIEQSSSEKNRIQKILEDAIYIQFTESEITSIGCCFLQFDNFSSPFNLIHHVIWIPRST